MLAHPGLPVEAPSRRRSNIYNNTGPDYSICYRIEEDIPTRVRSLLLSRHASNPPRTPWPSDEIASRHQEAYDAVEAFDFNTAKSVAGSARLQAARLSLPSRQVPKSSYFPEMLPVIGRNKRAAPRGSTSTNDPRAMDRSFDGVDADEEDQEIDNTMIHNTFLTSCPPQSPGKEDKALLNSRYVVPHSEMQTDHEDRLTATTPAIGSMVFKVKDTVDQALQSDPEAGSLPGPSIGLVPSRSSLRVEARAPSIETAASKSSAHRHALLKSSVEAGQSIDLGLPVQPILINAPDMLPISDSSETYSNTTTCHSHIHPLITPVESLTSLLQSPQIKDGVVEGERPNTSDPTFTVNYAVEIVTQNALRPIIFPPAPPGTHDPERISGDDRSHVLEPHTEVARTPAECLIRSSSGNYGSTISNRAVVSQVREHIGGVLPVYSTAQPDVMPNFVPDEAASYENIAPQESLGLRMASLQAEGVERGSKKHNWKTPSSKHYRQSQPKHSVSLPNKSPINRGTPIPKTSFKYVPYRNRFLEQLAFKSGRRARSTSSMSFSRTTPPVASDPQLPGNDQKELASTGKLDSHLGVNWLRQLLSDHEPYSTRLTTIPPRKHRHAAVNSKSARRFTTGSNVLITARENNTHSEPRESETFTRTINDLENLMDEALHIACQAAKRVDTDPLPDLLHNATALHDSIRQRAYSEVPLRSALYSQLSDNLSTRESGQESAWSTSSDSASQSTDVSMDEYQELYHRQPIIVSRNSRTWPLGHTPTAHAVPVLGGMKPVINDVLNDTVEVNSSEQEKAIDKTLVISNSVEAPKTRNENAEFSPHTKNNRQSEPLREAHIILEQGEHEAANSRQNGSVVRKALAIRQPYEEDLPNRIAARRPSKAIPNKREVREFIRVFHQPPIQPRHSSLALGKTADTESQPVAFTSAVDLESNRTHTEVSSQISLHTLSASQGSVSEIDLFTSQSFRNHAGPATAPASDRVYELKDKNEGVEGLPTRHISGLRLHDKLKHVKPDKSSHLDLQGKSHVSLREHKGFSLSRSHYRQPVARDWSPSRKRFVASVACTSTALIGILVGIYAGEVPSIQYYIADFSHYAILGNVFFFVALAISTFLFWPLPLLHGRKPYILSALTVAMPLLFPQAISVSMQRSPYVATWRVALILPRTFMGAALGFANMNFMATLTDLFGASLQSGNPHQETVNEYDVRRHGGGLGVWLGIWTWCYIGSIGVGFLIGALVINNLSPDWGFYISIVIIAAVLLLNVMTPEVRRSAYRRSVAEVRTRTDISRRLARGEVTMHRLQTGPKWWGEEFHQGVMLSIDMMRQPGFLVMSIYVAWMYGQVVLVIALLGSLMSKYYRFTSPAVGATTMAIPIGALLAVPFQKASLFSRARHHAQRTDSGTFDRRVSLTAHLVRRAIFTLTLPFAGLAYTLSSGGPPTPFIVPVIFAGLIGFLSNLAIAECNGIIMETFDTSDLQPGMTGRPRGASGDRTKHKRTNYSSFPRVSSAFAIIQSLGFLIGAAATGVGGVAERHLGQMAATGVMAAILLILTIGVLGVLYRWREIQIIPNRNELDMERWERERQLSIQRQEEAIRQGATTDTQPEIEEPWRPVIIGNPSGRTRRMSILELGHLSRWSEIRRKNRLVDEMSYEARHPNLATLEDVRKEIRDKNLGGLYRGDSRRSRRSQLSQGSEEPRPL